MILIVNFHCFENFHEFVYYYDLIHIEMNDGDGKNDHEVQFDKDMYFVFLQIVEFYYHL